MVRLLLSLKKPYLKAGSSLVTGIQEGINNTFIKNLIKQVDYLLKKDQEVVIISSGAVAKGMHELGIEERPASLHLLQACAAVGQRGLIQIYQNALDKYNYKTAKSFINEKFKNLIKNNKALIPSPNKDISFFEDNDV